MVLRVCAAGENAGLYKAITAGYDKLNNMVLPEVCADPEAKIGAKSDKKFWYGFKKHVAVDMQSGMITKVGPLDHQAALSV